MKKIGNLYFHGDRNLDRIALTFDDGPSKETKKILDLLKEYDAKATFFIWGLRIKGREKIIERMIKEGHEIGNHSYEHKRLIFRSKKYVFKDIKKCDDSLKKLGIKTKLFRFPGFAVGINSFIVCNKLGKKMIFADAISEDWKKEGIDKTIKKIMKKTKKGSILNFHDYLEGIGSNEEIIPILENVLPRLKGKFKMVTISKLLKFK